MIIVYIMVVWFTVLLFSSKNYLSCAIIILLASILNIIIVDVYELTVPLDYIAEKGFLISIDGLTAIMLTRIYEKDKLALNMSLLLAFSITCHAMIVYIAMEITSIDLFYNTYNVLIMLTGILQMWISRNGLISALRNIRDNILRISFCCFCYSKGLSASQKGKG